MTDTIQVEQPAEHVTVLRLDRPAQLNALDYPMVGARHDALDEAAADDSCRVIVRQHACSAASRTGANHDSTG
jgi:enoyl-CoA hydratase/carnithine racemase